MRRGEGKQGQDNAAKYTRYGNRRGLLIWICSFRNVSKRMGSGLSKFSSLYFRFLFDMHFNMFFCLQFLLYSFLLSFIAILFMSRCPNAHLYSNVCIWMDFACFSKACLPSLRLERLRFFVCFHLTFIVFFHNFCCIIHNGQVFYSWSCNPANKVLKVNWIRHHRNCYISKEINQFYAELLEWTIYQRIFCGVTAEIGHPGFLH